MSKKKAITIIIFCAVIIGVPSGAWMLGYVVRGLPCCPWAEFLTVSIQMAPLGVSLGSSPPWWWVHTSIG